MATITITGRDGSAGRGAADWVRTLLTAADAATQRLSTVLMLWHERACERRQLLALGDAALKDFGASRAEAACEGGKPFWHG